MSDTDGLERSFAMMGLEISDVLGNAVEEGTLLIAGRAKEILIEKEHVDSGTLLRDIKGQLVEVTRTEAEGAVGVAVVYGKFIEDLPDGGYLFEASEEKTEEAVRLVARRIEDALRRGSR